LRASSVTARRHNLPSPLFEGSLILVVTGAGCGKGIELKGVVGIDTRHLHVLGDLEEPRQAGGVEFVNNTV